MKIINFFINLYNKIFNSCGSDSKCKNCSFKNVCNIYQTNKIEETYNDDDYINPQHLYKLKHSFHVDIPDVRYITEYDASKPTVLIMDDYEGMVALMVDELLEVMQSINVNIIIATTDYAAFSVKKLLQNSDISIDIAFLDITIGGIYFDETNLIELDGIDIAKILWELNPSTEIKFITGNTLSEKNKELNNFINKFNTIMKSVNRVQCIDESFLSTFTYKSRINGKVHNKLAYNYIIHKSVNRLELMLYSIHSWYKRERKCNILGFQ